MAKRRAQPIHTYDELLRMAVDKCKETGDMPSRRSWTHDNFIDFEELKQVLGRGDWNRAEKVIREAYQGKAVKPETEAKSHTKEGEEMTNSALMKYQSYTQDNWLEWLHRLGNGRVLREESIQEKRPEQYDMIMELFDDWGKVEQAFHEKYGEKQIQPLPAMKSSAGSPQSRPAEQSTTHEMSNQKTLHTPDELLALAVQECIKQDKMPSDAKWMMTTALDFEELVMVLGDGNWYSAKLKIERTWEKYQAEQNQSKKVEKVEPPKETEPKTPAKHGKKPIWTYEKCLDSLCEMYKEHGRILSQSELFKMPATKERPSYGALLKYLGEKSGWEQLAKDCLRARGELDEDKDQGEPQNVLANANKAQNDKQPVQLQEDRKSQAKRKLQEGRNLRAELAREIVLTVHGMAVDVTLNGVRMKLQINFGPAKEE